MKKLYTLLLAGLSAGTAFGQINFTSSGIFTVPAGVTSIQVELVGPGGNGASNGGGGGGGGAYCSGTFTVVPATTYTIVVGQGGSGNATTINTLGISAGAGANGSGGSSATGGAGGIATGGTANRNGGAGGNGTYTYFGGGGGGAAGSVSAGGNGTTTPAYNNNCMYAGGAGGVGGGAPASSGGKGAGFTNNNCSATDAAASGSNYGGGGGGGNGISSTPGIGASGFVTITYCGVTAPPTGNANQSFCNGATVSDILVSPGVSKYYAAATGGSPLPSTTPLVNGTNYYIASVVGGCESGTRLDVLVTVTNLNLTTMVAGTTIRSTDTGATYRWYNCNTNTVITGATSQSYSPPRTGLYAVIVSKNGCVDTTTCSPVNGVSVGWTIGQYEVMVYPNPTKENLMVTTPTGFVNTNFTLTDVTGRVLISGILKNGTNSISLTNMPKGIYFLKAAGMERVPYRILKD